MERMTFNPEANPELLGAEFDRAAEASRTLQDGGYEAYAIGGCVRDLLLERQPKDYDLVTNAHPEQVTALFEKSQFPDTSQAFAVCRVRIGETEMEVATYRTDVDPHLGRHDTKVELASDLETDVSRRDFTINALALDLITNELIDHVGGLKDLDDRILRFVGDGKERIVEDPLRAIRAVRFKNKLDFNYEDQTRQAIIEATESGLLESISGERMKGELSSMLKDQNRSKAVMDLGELGILKRILPELSLGESSEASEQLLVLNALPESPAIELAWAALLRGIGETSEDKISPTSHGHRNVSNPTVRAILSRFKFSNEEKIDTLWLVHNCERARSLPTMDKSTQLAMFNHPQFENLLKLMKSVDASGLQTSDGQIQDIESLYQAHLQKPESERLKDLKHDLGIDGGVIMNRYAIQGKLVGEIKNALETAYQNEEIKSVDDAFQLADKLIQESH